MSPGYSHINFLKLVERRQHYFENFLHSTKIYIFLSKNIKDLILPNKVTVVKVCEMCMFPISCLQLLACC